ncbi:MAG: 30S ribosomal protein S2 [Candidatus Thorarchaeota archaeon]
MEEGDENLLIPLEDYLKAGIHIGTSSGLQKMNPYIYRVRNDGLYVLDVRKTDERIRVAAKFIARYDPSEVVVASVRTYGMYPAIRFAQFTGSIALTGRFIPGSFTNPQLSGQFTFSEPGLIIISDPNTDRQALKEANEVGIPVIALADTDNSTQGVDYVIPCNNKGRNSLATVFWLLTRETLRERGELTPERDTELILDNFRAPRGKKRVTESLDDL